MDREELNRPHPGFLNCPNGLLDLGAQPGGTWSLDPVGAKAQFLTWSISVPWRPGATDARWQRVLETSFPDPEVRACVLRMLGLALAGRMLVKALLLLHSREPNTGQRPLLARFAQLLGDYAAPVDSRLVMEAQFEGGHDRPDSQVAALAQKRFACAPELKRGAMLNGGRVKQPTGSGPT